MSTLTGSLRKVLSVNPIANNSSVLCASPVERVTEEQEGVSIEPANRPPTSVGDVDQEQQCGELPVSCYKINPQKDELVANVSSNVPVNRRGLIFEDRMLRHLVDKLGVDGVLSKLSEYDTKGPDLPFPKTFTDARHQASWMIEQLHWQHEAFCVINADFTSTQLDDPGAMTGQGQLASGPRNVTAMKSTVSRKEPLAPSAKQKRSCVDFGPSDSGILSFEPSPPHAEYFSEDQSESLCIHKDIKANCFVLGDVHTLHITHQGGTFPLHPFGPCGGEQQVECCATLEAPPGVVGSGVPVSVHYAIILDGPFEFPEKWERTSVVLYIDCPEKRLLIEPLHINLRHWAVCQPDVLAVMKANHDFSRRQREGKMFKQFSASAVYSPNAVIFYLKEHFCLICTAIKHPKSMNFNSQCPSTHPINCYLMKVPDDEYAPKFRIFLMYGVPSWAKAVSKYCLLEDGEKIPPVVPMVLSTDSVSVVLKRKEGNGWEAEMSRKELLRSKLDFSELSDLDCKEKKRGMNILAYPPYVDFLIVHKQTPREETHFKGMNNVIFKSGLNEVNFMVVVWEAKVQSNGDRTERSSNCVRLEMPRIQNLPMPDTNGVESASNPSSVAKHPCQKILKGAHLDKAPTDPELQKVSVKIPCWYNLAVALGVPVEQANAYKSSDTGGLDALCYWRNGRSGEEYSSTWKFLLDKIAETQGSTVAEEVYLFSSLYTTPKMMESCSSNGFRPSPSDDH